MDSRIPIIISLIAIIGSPWIGSVSIVSNTLVRLLLLLYILYCIHISDLLGLLAVLAVVSIISERNYRTITGIPHHTGIPMKRDSVFENINSHVTPVPSASASADAQANDIEYKDGNPRLIMAPTGARSARFYMDKKLSV
jgi:hypothetical protein